VLARAGVSEEVPAAARRHQLPEGSDVNPVRKRQAVPRWLLLGCAAAVGVLGILLWHQLAPNLAPVEARTGQTTTEITQPTPAESTSAKLSLSQPTAAATLPAKIATLSRLQSALAGAPQDQQDTAARLLAFAGDGDLARIDSVSADQVEALAATLLAADGGEELNRRLEEGLHLPPDFLSSHPNPARAVADLFEAVKGAGDPNVARSLVFTDHCEENGAATGNVHVIPAGTQRVYAAFENAGGLHGLHNVFAVWRNPSDAKMVFAEYESVHSGSAFNYVWLELNNGWPAGYYELALYHPERTTELLASRSFNVR